MTSSPRCAPRIAGLPAAAHRLLALAIGLLWRPNAPIPLLDARILPRTAWSFWTGAAVTLAGLLFSAAARAYLGRNWSGTVTLKQDHELVTRGPYRFVRHPIYTGLLLAFLGPARTRGPSVASPRSRWCCGRCGESCAWKSA